MGSTFAEAGEDVRVLARHLIVKYHLDLSEANVKIDYIFAFGELDKNSEKKAPALMLHGVRCLGIAKKLGLKDRVMGRGDCEISIDGDEWPNMTPQEQAALLDHELEHFEVKRDKTGGFLMDDIDRPVIVMRKHDRDFGWFDNIARRHGRDSFEIKQFRQLLEEGGQGVYTPHLTAESSFRHQDTLAANQLGLLADVALDSQEPGGPEQKPAGESAEQTAHANENTIVVPQSTFKKLTRKAAPSPQGEEQ